MKPNASLAHVPRARSTATATKQRQEAKEQLAQRTTLSSTTFSLKPFKPSITADKPLNTSINLELHYKSHQEFNSMNSGNLIQ